MLCAEIFLAASISRGQLLDCIKLFNQIVQILVLGNEILLRLCRIIWCQIYLEKLERKAYAMQKRKWFFYICRDFLDKFFWNSQDTFGPYSKKFFPLPFNDCVSWASICPFFFFLEGGLKISLATHMIITQKIFNQFSWNSYHIMVHNNFRTLKCILQLHKSVCPILFSVKSLTKNSKIWAFPNQYAHLFENLQNFYFLHLKRVQSLKVPKYQHRELLAKFMRSSSFSLLCPQIEFNIETKLRTP